MKIIEAIISLSPYGVFCLIAPVVAQNGPKVIGSLALVIVVAYISYFVHLVAVYSALVGGIAHISPARFFSEMAPAMMMAFSSASSVGTLPLNMKCTNKLGAREDISSFVLPLGATINMDGTAIYHGVCTIFIAACFGINLTFQQLAIVVVTATISSIGTAGVPGAGVVMLAMVLQAVGLPVEGIALVLGVDRIFDMGRTTLNITGDAVCALCITKIEHEESKLKITKAIKKKR
ncbi:MAG: dicarboxylate/amino acid:cation symporter, partial [Lachnospiraceae bacterium]|nr:dicarboxylate/amino acid:cation symporter [Lachnospiraceae bacterium]